jgi:hypothetical protein
MKINFVYKAPPNNGMHPTADTNLVICFQRLGAAGDAGRWAPLYHRKRALHHKSLPSGR